MDRWYYKKREKKKVLCARDSCLVCDPGDFVHEVWAGRGLLRGVWREGAGDVRLVETGS